MSAHLPQLLSASTRSMTASSIADRSARDPLGLKMVHRPPQERKVDIIFVHGLGCSSRMTWSKNHDLDYFWPLKFLPSEPEIGDARILTFGYNANFRPGSGKNSMSVLDFAKGLLYDLKYATDEPVPELEDLRLGEKLIIFVVHSMGGLIVKEAYMQGKDDPKYASIIQAISSIIFLSTPHRGTNLAETLNRILKVSFASAPMQSISELVAGSQTVQKLNESSDMWPKSCRSSRFTRHGRRPCSRARPRSWCWRRSHLCLAIRARYPNPSTPTTMVSASTAAPMIRAMSLSGMC